MTDSSATELLRELLDERGVEWWSEDDQEEPAYYFVTKWFANGCKQTYEEIPAIRSRSLKAYCVLPEQAIAATLGSGECEIYRVGNTQDVRKCSACGKLMHFNHPLDRDCLNYCPNCGKAVKR